MMRYVATEHIPVPLEETLGEFVRASCLSADQPLPLFIEPAVEDVDLTEWIAEYRDALQAQLLVHGALLFRGFGVRTPEAFERAAQAFCPALFDAYGDLPRDEVSTRVFGSTPYPAEQVIRFHNESSHLDTWPLKIFFGCMRAAAEGGETPLVDGRRVYARLNPETRDEFERRGLLYVRTYHQGLDVSWREFFRTDDRAEVERYCTAHRLQCEWMADGALQTRSACAAVTRHPATGESIFFNQVQLHHPACLPPEVRQAMGAIYQKSVWPRTVSFGDGGVIDDARIEEVCRVEDEMSVRFPWQEGDILAVDNMLVAHGRASFKGTRKIVVAMGDLVGATSVSH